MLGVIIDAIGVPAAAIRCDAPGAPTVVAANGALELLLGCAPGALTGALAATFLPDEMISRLTGYLLGEPVDVRLGEIALPYRVIARPLPVDLSGRPDLL